MFITLPSNYTLNKPLIFPSISDSTSPNLVLLIGNLYTCTLSLKKGQQLAVGCIVSFKEINSIHTVGDTTNLGLAKPTEEETQELNKLLNEFKDIFSTSDQDFGLLINSFHDIKTGTNKPFKSKPYWKSHSKEQIVFNEI